MNVDDINVTDLYLNNLHSDVTLVIDNVELPAHRTILSEQSEYFNAMFSNPFKEATSEKIILKQTNLDAFKVVLNYIYNGSMYLWLDGIHTCFDTVFEVLACARFYMVDTLTEYVVNIIKKKLETDPTKFLNYACAYSAEELIWHCSYLIQMEAPFIFEKEKFKRLSFLTVQHLLKLRLNARESTIFEALIDWMRSNPDCSDLFLGLLEHIDLYLLDENHLNMLFEPTQLVDPGLFQALMTNQQKRLEKVTKIVNHNVINGLHDLRIVAGEKWLNRRLGYFELLYQNNTIIIDLKQNFLLNCLKLYIHDYKYDATYAILVSKDGRDWELVVDHSKHKCFKEQLLYFNERPVRFIRFQTEIYDGSKLDAYIEALYSTDPMEIDGDRTFLVPKQKLVLTQMKCLWGYRSYTIHLPQPCIINTIKLLLENGPRSCFKIEVAANGNEIELVANEKCWKLVSVKVNGWGWQTAIFDKQPVMFIKITSIMHVTDLCLQELEIFAA